MFWFDLVLQQARVWNAEAEVLKSLQAGAERKNRPQPVLQFTVVSNENGMIKSSCTVDGCSERSLLERSVDGRDTGASSGGSGSCSPPMASRKALMFSVSSML